MSTQVTAAAPAETNPELSTDSATETEHERLQPPATLAGTAPDYLEGLTFTELVGIANAWDPWGDPWKMR